MSVLSEFRPLTPAPEASDEGIALVAKALSHPARLRILRLLLEKRSCIGCDIVEEVGLAQSTVSEHLRILRAAGVVRGEAAPPRVCYHLNPESLRPLAALLDTIFRQEREGELSGSICCPPGLCEPPENPKAPEEGV